MKKLPFLLFAFLLLLIVGLIPVRKQQNNSAKSPETPCYGYSFDVKKDNGNYYPCCCDSVHITSTTLICLRAGQFRTFENWRVHNFTICKNP